MIKKARKRCQVCGGGSPYKDVQICWDCRLQGHRSSQTPRRPPARPKVACKTCGDPTTNKTSLCSACAAYDDYRRMIIVEAIDPACLNVKKWWPLTAAGWREGCGV
jgi:DnaJ-class molecular chaperone